jgi:hypothetical protein
MLEGIRIARDMGFEVGIVTNAYGAISEDDAEIWLHPLAKLGVAYLSISDDSFHYGEREDSPAKRALVAARKLGIPTSPICIQKPFVEAMPGQGQDKGNPVGHIHVCQGLSMGNMWQCPLSVLALEYDADSHPICGPLTKGGPALLARQYDVEPVEGEYVDECHFCYLVRRALIDRFPESLAPRQVYGLEEK